MRSNVDVLNKRFSAFSNFAWPEEFGYRQLEDRYQDNDVELEKKDDEKVKQKLNSLCRRSFLSAESEEERNFLSRVCDENVGDENKGNEILYEETTRPVESKKLPRLANGYGQHLGRVRH